MNLLVYGAGALGVYFGGRWMEAGHQVSFLVREKRRKQIEENGLHIQSVAGDYTIEHPHLISSAAEVQECDIVVLAVKGYHLDSVIPALKELVKKGARVLPLLNGIEHIYKLQEELGQEAVIGGLAFIIATLDENGHVAHSSNQHDLIVGPLASSQSEACRSLVQELKKGNMNVSFSENAVKSLWQKYMFITAFSGVTTASDLPIGRIRGQEDALHLFKSVLLEMKELANAYEVDLQDQDIEETMKRIEHLPYEATSSMHQDRRKGLFLEVDHLQGGAMRLAAQKGHKLPRIETLHALIKLFERDHA